jgi:hypothetical protein
MMMMMMLRECNSEAILYPLCLFAVDFVCASFFFWHGSSLAVARQETELEMVSGRAFLAPRPRERME